MSASGHVWPIFAISAGVKSLHLLLRIRYVYAVGHGGDGNDPSDTGDA